MPTRRRTLTLAGGLLTSLAGCLNSGGPSEDGSPTRRSGGSPTASPSAATTPGPSGTPTVAGTEQPTDAEEQPPPRTEYPDAPAEVTTVSGDLPAWEPDRWIDAGYSHVLGLEAANGRLYAILNDEDGHSAVAAIDPVAGSILWTTSLDGDPEAGSHVERERPTETWGVTVHGGTVYSVHGRGKSYEWTELHALGAAGGDRQWSVRREKRLTLHAFSGDTAIVGGREFFEPDGTHDTPQEPLETTVYGVETASGEQRWAWVDADVRGVAANSDGVYVAHKDVLTALDPGGNRRWTRRGDDEIRDLVVVNGVVVLVVGPNDEASSLVGYSTAGDRVWTVDMATRYLLPGGDRVYAMADNVATITRDGTVAWRQRVPGHDPLLADGHRLYTRTGVRMNAVDAFQRPSGDRRFRFETPSKNGWPLGATDRTLVAEAITPEKAAFTSLFAVDAETGEPRAVYRPSETVFSAQGYEAATFVGFSGGRIGVFGDPD
jgi:hypothetical protein